VFAFRSETILAREMAYGIQSNISRSIVRASLVDRRDHNNERIRNWTIVSLYRSLVACSRSFGGAKGPR
jgi:hypothetical protein